MTQRADEIYQSHQFSQDPDATQDDTQVGAYNCNATLIPEGRGGDFSQELFSPKDTRSTKAVAREINSLKDNVGVTGKFVGSSPTGAPKITTASSAAANVRPSPFGHVAPLGSSVIKQEYVDQQAYNSELSLDVLKAIALRIVGNTTLENVAVAHWNDLPSVLKTVTPLIVRNRWNPAGIRALCRSIAFTHATTVASTTASTEKYSSVVLNVTAMLPTDKKTLSEYVDVYTLFVRHHVNAYKTNTKSLGNVFDGFVCSNTLSEMFLAAMRQRFNLAVVEHKQPSIPWCVLLFFALYRFCFVN